MSSAQDIEGAAANWLIRREEPDWSADDEARLQAWIDESYAHKAAYWRLECGWRKADRIAALGSDAAAPLQRRRRVPDWRWLAAAASLAGVALIPALIPNVPPRSSEPAAIARFQTPVGGHEQVKLADGSTAELNTATVIRADVSSKRREIWLDEGEAFFSVKPSRIPFVVHAGPREVTVLGTKFSVSREDGRVRVAVVEGKVRVSGSDRSDPAAEATITPGDLLTAEGESTLVLQQAAARVERSLAWRDGMLQFDQTPLAAAAEEFNRYNGRKLVVVGQAGTIPIGGSFRASNVDAFARLLQDAYGLRVEQAGNEMRISD
jgi:transmembrane sensor